MKRLFFGTNGRF